MSTVKRTYSSRNRQVLKSSPSSLQSSPLKPSAKRPFSDSSKDNEPLYPPRKRLKATHIVSSKLPKKTASHAKPVQKKLTQLHLAIDQSILRTCPLCELRYTKGAPEDEALHRSHCTRVRQSMEWGREEAKDRTRNGRDMVNNVKTDIRLIGKTDKGRIISFPADINGKIGAKLSMLLQTINISLSAPDLPQSVLQGSKAYFFLVPHENISHRERIVGCVIAQRITTAMAVVPSTESALSSATDDTTTQFISVDPSTGLFCNPAPLPTPMGIPRLFVPTTHRRLGIARYLLTAAAETFIHGCPLDPSKGQVAFSQPTGIGQKVMKSWGKGGIRVYEE